MQRLAGVTVTNEEDVVDMSNPPRVSTRIYRVRNVESKTGKPRVQPVRDGGRGQPSRAVEALFQSADILWRKNLRANNSTSQKIFGEI
jgi:hypothetical protein